MKSGPAIAIVGMACVYPDARTPVELWENVLAQRRAFRRLPAERLRCEEYWSADRGAADCTYATEAAVIEGYEFDRVAFRVVGGTFRSADLAHWLALDVAAKALADAGFPEGRGLSREATGVLLGNTLTGEFSRANALRLRWPYVRRVVEAGLAGEGWDGEARRAFLDRLEAEYKAPFPSSDEETLAGGLSNTIAGRICNHFDLQGGGYTVDGACASSLLAVANACAALSAGDLDMALAGGVDLSLDPFELVGFAKTGALASEEMRVFDRRSAGFWPGEGCGFVTLMRREDALAQGRRIYAVIRGWGISSDGSGGITRPEAAGQLEALRRAYRRAGFGPDTVMYCEGHGTGTAVGDATELEVLSRARRDANPNAPAAAIGSLKANIGHTKAAAGVAGLIKAAMAVHTQVLPPATGCGEPHALLTGNAPALRALREAELWPKDQPLRASVSAMGFGGINAHVVLEGAGAKRRSGLATHERLLARSSQDAELFLLAAQTEAELAGQIDVVLALAERISRAELTDVAACLQKRLESGLVRAGVVASKPVELAERLRVLKTWLKKGVAPRLRCEHGIFLGSSSSAPRIAFLFPGQGSPVNLEAGVWRQRFENIRDLYGHANLHSGGAPEVSANVSTRVAQPAVVTASLAGLRVLRAFGVFADAAIGHSLGEITALHWAGVFDEAALLRIAETRGAAMADLRSPAGAMLALAAPWRDVQALLNGDPLSIVSFNSPRQTVVAGEATTVRDFERRVASEGWRCAHLPVATAFHTPLVAAAVPALFQQLQQEEFARIKGKVVSTVTGGMLRTEEDLRELLCRQVTAPVQFDGAMRILLEADTPIELLIEVGQGTVLSGLAHEISDVPAISVDAGGNSLVGLLEALGAAFALGAPVQHGALFADRLIRPFSLDWHPKFFANPCEQAPVLETTVPSSKAARFPVPEITRENESSEASLSPLELLRGIVAERIELPVAAVQDHSRMLSDLHLNSITVGQMVAEAARQLGLPRLAGLTEFANASLAEIASALAGLKSTRAGVRPDLGRLAPPGVDTWVRAFTMELVEKRLNGATRQVEGAGGWQVFGSKRSPLTARLGRAFARATGGGVVVCLPENPGGRDAALLLQAARAAVATAAHSRFVVVQHGWGGSGFARTLHLEAPGLTTCVVNVPSGQPAAGDWIVAEAARATGFVEAHYTADGRRWEPRLKLAEHLSAEPAARNRGKFPVGRNDVLLVTGGGKGIAAECALALARETGVRLALLGRSDPQADQELADNLARIGASGARWYYVRADVTDARSVRVAVKDAVRKLGPVTAVLHGAGVNEPRLIRELDEAAFQRTLAPKVQGARNVLAAVDVERLRLLVTFGSIIARVGLSGEADYATANEWLTELTREFRARHPKCRCLALEWSVWSGAGMGERLGRVEALAQQGITPITVDEGVRVCCDLLARPARETGAALVVCGRFGEPPTLKLADMELPLLRFLERKRVFYPGVELVVDASLTPGSDPYLDDHVVQKQRLFPAAMGLEAMAQAAMALTSSRNAPGFEKVEFLRPVAVSGKRPVTIRLAALRRGANLVEVCLRSEETEFQIDHFRAFCRFGEKLAMAPVWKSADDKSGLLRLDPQTDLYGRILFHRGRFCRLRGYRLLRARECVAEIGPDEGAAWFGPYLPGEFVLGDPGARDAALHAIQACIPHQRILPTGVDKLVIGRVGAGMRWVRARERMRDGSHFIYDVEVTNGEGVLLERWEGLHLRAVEMLARDEAWPEALMGPYLERRLEELESGVSLNAVLGRGGKSDKLIQGALGKPTRVWRRPDGKPEVAGVAATVSVAHSAGLTLAVTGGATACDLETVAARSEEVWRDLLSAEGVRLAARVARECAEGQSTAATRLWSAIECLKKSGKPVMAPLVLESVTPDGWVMLRSGTLSVATWVVAVQGLKEPFVVAVAVPRKEGTG